MEAAGEQDSSTKTVTAAPITAVIAARVKALRTEARMSGPALAKELTKLGVPWNRTTIAKFETGGRHSITVQELLALALALGVPPVMLLADPRHVDEVPLAEGAVGPAWDALMWLVGRTELTAADGPPRSQDAIDAVAVIWSGVEIIEATSELTMKEYRLSGSDPEALDALEAAERREAARHRVQLVRINRALDKLRSIGAPEPQLNQLVLDRAKELDFALFPQPTLFDPRG